MSALAKQLGKSMSEVTEEEIRNAVFQRAGIYGGSGGSSGVRNFDPSSGTLN